MKPTDLIPYEKNNKIHDDEQVERIANSIKEFWFIQPLVIDQDNVVIIGHGRLLAAKKLWLKEVPVVKKEDLTEKQVKKLRIWDNKLNESPYDIENLKLELEDLWGDLSIWELHLEIEDVFPDLADKEEENEVKEDEVPEVKEAKIVGGGTYLFFEIIACFVEIQQKMKIQIYYLIEKISTWFLWIRHTTHEWQKKLKVPRPKKMQRVGQPGWPTSSMIVIQMMNGKSLWKIFATRRADY